MTFRDILEKRMFIVIGITWILINLTANNVEFGVNKTIGWAWDITNWVYWAGLINWLIPLGYIFLALLKFKTSYIISILQILSIVLLSILGLIDKSQLDKILYLNIIIAIIFIFNFFGSLIRRSKY